MVVAMTAVHWKNGFFVTKNGIEYPLVLAAAASGLAFSGPGDLSTDAVLGIAWTAAAAVAALVLGALAAAVQLSGRRAAPVAVAQESGQ